MSHRFIPWSKVDSKSELAAIVATKTVVDTLVTSDPNAWGYFQLPSGHVLQVAYANLGLPPVAAIVDDLLFVGVNEVLVGYDLIALHRTFDYRMPCVFHEFVSLSEQLIVRDELGFVALSRSGVELWAKFANGPIDHYDFDPPKIHFTTIDGEESSFLMSE